MASLGSLEVGLKLNRSEFDASLKKAQDDLAGLGAKDIKFKVNISMGDGANIKSKLEAISNIYTKLESQFSNPLVLKVDDKALTALNQHLTLKQSHYAQVRNYFNSAPLEIKVNDASLTKINLQLDALSAKFKQIKGEFTGLDIDSSSTTTTTSKSRSKKIKPASAQLFDQEIEDSLSIVKNLSKFTNQADQTWQRVGKEISEGLSQGINKGKVDVSKAAADLGIAAEQATRKATQTQSPSKIFEKIGEDIAAGLAIGIRKGTALVQNALNQITHTSPTTTNPQQNGMVNSVVQSIKNGTGSVQAALNNLTSNKITPPPILTPQQGQSQGSSFVSGLISGFTQSFSSVTGMLGPAAIGALLAQPFAMAATSAAQMFNSIITDAYDTAESLERIRFKLEQITGSTTKATDELKYFKEFTNEYGGSASKLALASANLQVNSYGTSLANSKNSDQVIKGFQTAFIAKRLTKDEQAEGLEYINRIAMSGELDSRVLSKEIPRILPGFLGTASRAYGVNQQQLLKLVRKQELDPYEFLEKVGTQLEKENKGGAKEAQSTTTAQLERLQMHIKGLQAAIGTQLVAAAGAAASVINRMFDAFERHKDTFQELGSIIGRAFSVFNSISISVDKVLIKLLKFAIIKPIFEANKFYIDAMYSAMQSFDGLLHKIQNSIAGLFKGFNLPPQLEGVLKYLHLAPSSNAKTESKTETSSDVVSSSRGVLTDLQTDFEKNNARLSVLKSLTENQLSASKLQIEQGLANRTLGKSAASILTAQAESASQGQIAGLYQQQFSSTRGKLAGQFDTTEGKQVLAYLQQYGLNRNNILSGNANVEGIISHINEDTNPANKNYLPFLHVIQDLYGAKAGAMGAETGQAQAQAQAEDAIRSLQEQFRNLNNSIADFGTELKKSLLESQNALKEAKENLKADQFKRDYLAGKTAGTGSAFDSIFNILDNYETKMRQINAAQDKSGTDKLSIEQNAVKLARQSEELERQKVEMQRNLGGQIVSTFANNAAHLTKINDSVNSIVNTFSSAAAQLEASQSHVSGNVQGPNLPASGLIGNGRNISLEGLDQKDPIKRQRQMFQRAYALAQAAGDPQAAVTAAQFIQETGGNQSSVIGAHNWFNQTGVPGKDSGVWHSGGVMHPSKQYFKNYSSDEAAFIDHANHWNGKLSGVSPLAAIQDIQKRGYAEDPNYIPSIVSILKQNGINPYGASAQSTSTTQIGPHISNVKIGDYIDPAKMQSPYAGSINQIKTNQLTSNAIETQDNKLKKEIENLEIAQITKQDLFAKQDEQIKLDKLLSKLTITQNNQKLTQLSQSYSTADQQRQEAIDSALAGYTSYIENITATENEFKRKSESSAKDIELLKRRLALSKQLGADQETIKNLTDDITQATINQAKYKQIAKTYKDLGNNAKAPGTEENIINNTTNKFNLDQGIANAQYSANLNSQYAAAQSRKTFDPFGSINVAASIEKLKADFKAQDRDLEIEIKTKLNIDPNGPEANEKRRQLQAVQEDQIEQAKLNGDKVASGFSTGFADGITGLIDRSKTPLQALEGLLKAILQPIAKNVGDYFAKQLTDSIFGTGAGSNNNNIVANIMDGIKQQVNPDSNFMLDNELSFNNVNGNDVQTMQSGVALGAGLGTEFANFGAPIVGNLFKGLLGFYQGGMVRNYASGGLIDLGAQAASALTTEQLQNGGITPVLAALTPGEYVVPKNQVNAMLNPQNMAINDFTNASMGIGGIGGQVSSSVNHTINNNWNVAIHQGNAGGMSDSQVRAYNQMQTDRSLKRFG